PRRAKPGRPPPAAPVPRAPRGGGGRPAPATADSPRARGDTGGGRAEPPVGAIPLHDGSRIVGEPHRGTSLPAPGTPRPAPARLNPKYTFETFVIGSSNRFAHAAAVAVAEAPPKPSNPLFTSAASALPNTPP